MLYKGDAAVRVPDTLEIQLPNFSHEGLEDPKSSAIYRVKRVTIGFVVPRNYTGLPTAAYIVED